MRRKTQHRRPSATNRLPVAYLPQIRLSEANRLSRIPRHRVLFTANGSGLWDHQDQKSHPERSAARRLIHKQENVLARGRSSMCFRKPSRRSHIGTRGLPSAPPAASGLGHVKKRHSERKSSIDSTRSLRHSQNHGAATDASQCFSEIGLFLPFRCSGPKRANRRVRGTSYVLLAHACRGELTLLGRQKIDAGFELPA